MTEDVFSLVVGLRMSRDIYMCLEKKFAQSSKDRELQLHSVNCSYVAKGSLYLLSYCDRSNPPTEVPKLPSLGQPLSSF